MALAISYRRVSSGKQLSGKGLERQDDDAVGYCERTGDKLDEQFVDAGMSAFRGKNAAAGRLARIMELAEAGTWPRGTKLLVEHFDRLSRDKLTEARQRCECILKAGLTIVTLADGQEYTWDRINNDLGAIILMTVMMFKSHEESALKGKRVASTRAMRREAARNGEVKLTRQCPHWLRAVGGGRDFDFVLKPAEAAVVRRICEEAASGMGKRLITTRLNQDGISPPKGYNGWHHSTVGALLRDRRLIGELQPMRVLEDGRRGPNGNPIPDYYPAVIDRPLFHRVQAAVRDRRYEEGRKGSGGRKGWGYPNLFLGLGKCAECGAPLIYESAGGSRKKRRTLVCGAAIRNHGGCTNRKGHFYPPFEAEMILTLSLLDCSRLLSPPRANYDREAELAAEIADRVETQRQLLTAFTAKTPGAVLERISELEAEIDALRSELRAHNDNRGITEALRDYDRHAEFVSLVEHMHVDMDDDDRFVLRTKLAQEFRRIIDVMLADPEGITVRLKPAPHQRVEFRFADHAVQSMTIWSREAIHPDYPANDMRPFVTWPRDILFGDDSDLIGMFSQFTEAA
jgi:DNA invertase Pin-like site-specific DNA recombinase